MKKIIVFLMVAMIGLSAAQAAPTTTKNNREASRAIKKLKRHHKRKPSPFRHSRSRMTGEHLSRMKCVHEKRG